MSFLNKKNILVFDDGGFITSNPDNTGFKIKFYVYERILELAKRNEIKIPIACTASFFDFNKLYNKSIPNPDSDKILSLVMKNPDYLEIWNHGLTHMFGNNYTEFDLYSKETITENIQDEKIRLSQKIFTSLGITSSTLVPPGHAWQQGVTDKIAKQYGIKNIAIREFEKTSLTTWLINPMYRYKKTWAQSDYLKTYFRMGLGIRHDLTSFKSGVYRKTKYYIRNIYPSSIIINRRFTIKYPVDHFFAHVQNLMGDQGFDYFDFVLKEILKKESVK